jgi:hypothetical protein
MQTLDYDEMLALAGLYERWAFTEQKLDGEQRTRLIQMSADYERIAGFCGAGWAASQPDNEPDAVKFIARTELKDRLSTTPS